jgi:hypothetical protein
VYAIRRISFSSFHEHSWRKVGGRRRKSIHYTNYKKEGVREHMASTVGVITL